MTRRSSDWLAGLLVGVLGGILFFLFPLLAIALLAAFAVLAYLRPTRLLGLSGALVGIGAGSLVLLGRSILECSNFDAAPNQECVQPDLTPWLVAAAVMLLVGAGLAAAAWRRPG